MNKRIIKTIPGLEKETIVTTWTPGNQVELRHIPTGIHIQCDENPSKTKNKELAFEKLRQKLKELEEVNENGI